MNDTPSTIVLPARSFYNPWTAVGLGLLLTATLLLTGCASGSNADRNAASTGTPPVNLRVGIPPQAKEVAQGKGSVSYEAQGSGQVYVYDLNANDTVGTYNVREGEELIIAARAGRATLASNELKIGELSGGRTYVLYYLPLGQGPTYQLTPTN